MADTTDGLQGMGKIQRLVVIGLTASLVVFFDQGSKYIAVRLLQDREIISLFYDCLRFLLVENRGGFLSLGASLPDGARTLIFLLLTSIFIVGFFIYTFLDNDSTPAALIASSMIIGGGVGNVIDRGYRDGSVIDFVNVGVGVLRTGIFNLADMAVLFGCVLLTISLVRTRKKMEKSR
jgi:signal peptidase II